MVATAPYANIVGSHAGLAGSLKVAPFVVNFDSSALTDEIDVLIGKLPAHSLVVGGWLAATDLDTGTEALELDFGWAANGGAQSETYLDPAGVSYDNAGYQAVQTGFIDSGIVSGDAVTDLFPAGVSYRPVILTKPLYFRRETNILMRVEVPAATQAAGSATFYLLYIAP